MLNFLSIAMHVAFPLLFVWTLWTAGWTIYYYYVLSSFVPLIPVFPYAILALVALVGGVWASATLGIDICRRLEKSVRERKRRWDNLFERSDRRKRS